MAGNLTPNDLAWWQARLDPNPDGRPGYYVCPICGASNLHVEAAPQNGKPPLVNPFSCEHRYAAVRSELESRNGTEPTLQIRRRKAAAVARPSKADALQSLAEYCGVDRAVVDALPVQDGGSGEPVFSYPSGAMKRRHWSGDAKYTWEVSGTAPIWPYEPVMPDRAVFTEGETDCIVLRALGIIAYSLGSASDSPTPAEWAAMYAAGLRTAVLGYDADTAGRVASGKAAIGALAAGLEVEIIVPPDYNPLTGLGKDWRDYFKAGATSLPQPLNDAVLKTRAELALVMDEKYDWAAEPFLYYGGLTLLAGREKDGKTSFAEDMEGSVCRGESYLSPIRRVGRKTDRSVKLIRLTEEAGASVFEKHDDHRLPTDTLYLIYALDGIGRTFDETLAIVTRQVRRWLRDGHSVIVDVDTVSTWSGLDDERDEAKVTALMNLIRATLVQQRVAVLVEHHFRKATGHGTDPISGSTRWGATADILLLFGRTDSDVDSERAVNLFGRPKAAQGYWTLNYNVARSTYQATDAGSGQRTLNPHPNAMKEVGKDNASKVLAAMPATLMQIAAATGLSQGTVVRHTAALEASGLATPSQPQGNAAAVWEAAS